MSKIPTIALIPSGYKANKLYSVLPTNGDGDLTTARTSTATRVNEVGLIEDVASGVPRLDYSDGSCPSYLIEPASTNLMTYSEDFSDASWTKENLSITTNSETSPKLDLTADSLIEDTSNGVHSVRKLLSVTSGLDYAYSVFVKASLSPRDIHITSSDAGISVYFDTTNWVVGAEVLGTGEIINYGNGWYRLIAKGTATSTGNENFRISLSDGITSGSQTYTGNGVNFMYLWGAQLEEQSYATSYIPTSGTTVTRVGETASKTGLSSYINSSEGVLYIESKALVSSGGDRAISLANSSSPTTNTISFFYFSSTNTIRVLGLLSGSTQFSFDYVLSDVTNFSKIAIKYKENDFALWVNGVEVGTDTVGSTFTANSLDSLNFFYSSGNFYGKVKDLRVFNEALTDAELITLTT